MEKYTGKTVCNKVAMGKVLKLDKKESSVKRQLVEDTDKELERFYKCKEKALEQLNVLYEKALVKVGETDAAIFEAHKMLIDNEDYIASVENIIKAEKVNAEYAIEITRDRFAELFAAMDDEFMRARSADVKDISSRLVRILLEKQEAFMDINEEVIIVANDLTPSEIVQLDKSKILAIVTTSGSNNSHTAILAKTMNIPYLVGVNMKLSDISNGCMAIVDGSRCEIIFNPDEEEMKKAMELIKNDTDNKKLLDKLKGCPTVTKSGRKIKLYANIGNESDLKEVIENDAEGIGLFRSECIYLERENFPSEEEQFLLYKNLLEKMEGKKVIVRTLDIGADKQADYFNLEKEENPALGYRAIRICLTQTDIFKTQLRALLRASVYGELSIMYPMIISVDEVLRIKEIVAEVKTELEAKGISFKDVEEGIMIETPASVMISDELAKLVDFFSVGTNDLTQYTLAIDRQNSKLDAFYNPHHEAILKMIKMATDNAHLAGKRIGICGELGADVTLTEKLVEMGIDELSVVPSMILPLRKIVREIK